MFERFNDRARGIVVLAKENVKLLHHENIETAHILLAVLQQGEGVAAESLQHLGLSYEKLKQKVGERFEQKEKDYTLLTPDSKKALELSISEALRMGSNYIDPVHILLGLIRHGDDVLASILREEGIDLSRIPSIVFAILRGESPQMSPVEIAKSL